MTSAQAYGFLSASPRRLAWAHEPPKKRTAMPAPPQMGQLELEEALGAAESARGESIRAEEEWRPLLEDMMRRLKMPSHAAAVRECARILSVRAFRHTQRLRAHLQTIERIVRGYGAMHAADLDAMCASLNAESSCCQSLLASELSALDAQVAQLQEERAQQRARIAQLEATVASLHHTRKIDAERLHALLPEGDDAVSPIQRRSSHLRVEFPSRSRLSSPYAHPFAHRSRIHCLLSFPSIRLRVATDRCIPSCGTGADG